MRRALMGFMMLLILMPGLACGTFMGMYKEAQPGQMTQGMEDCEGMIASKNDSIGTCCTFFKDCFKVDLQTADHTASLKTPDTSSQTYTVAWAFIVPVYNVIPTAANTIRGPPPDWPILPQNQPSILLTTQRLRI